MATDPATDDLDHEFDLIPDNAPVKFDSGEHADIPSQCKLKFSEDGKKILNGNDVAGCLWPLNYKSSDKEKFPLTFAKIIAYGGDFYTNEPLTDVIAYGPDFAERRKRFRVAVSNMCIDPIGLLKFLEGYLQREVDMFDEVITEAVDKPQNLDQSQDKVLEDIGTHKITQAYKKETGGTTGISTQFAKVGIARYGEILQWNMDHFGEMAWDCYITGHAEALRIAKECTWTRYEGKLVTAFGGYYKWSYDWDKNRPIEEKLSKEDALKMAYLYDAFALHYLSDQFSAGHTRCPRMEMNRPIWQMTAMTLTNKLASFLTKEWLSPNRGGWDGMTGFLHDFDNATGLRVSNKNGDEWICFGDAQYFIEANRVNRLKSIECVQQSISEVYDTWRTGQYPQGSTDAKGNFNEKGEGFEALKVAPQPVGHTIAQNSEETGNPSCLWVVEKDDRQPSAKDVAMGKAAGLTEAQIQEKINKASANVDKAQAAKDKREADKKAEAEKQKPQNTVLAPITRAPVGTGIDGGQPEHSENGFFFARRKDVNNCSVTRYQWGSPGFGLLLASDDVSAVEDSAFMSDKTPKDARAMEPLSGGFIQVQEYSVDQNMVNYGVNVWGPVEVPLEWLPGKNDKKKDDLKKAVTLPARQFTFTWRGRRTGLCNKPEVVTDSKTFRWHSWFDPDQKRQTSLLKFTFCKQDSTIAKGGDAIVLESWSFTDPDAAPKQQWTQYENMKPERRLVFGGPGSTSTNDMKKTVLFSPFSSTDWNNVAHATRFLVFPFLRGSTSYKPDIVTFTWRTTDNGTTAQPMITVASTDSQLRRARIVIEDKSLTLSEITSTDKSSAFRGFIKQFEDIKNKPVILHVRGTSTEPEADQTVKIIAQVFKQNETDNKKLDSFYKDLSIPYTRPTNWPGWANHLAKKKDFYAILVGDTRLTGHKELVVLMGHHPYWYLSAWELDSDGGWAPTSGTNRDCIPVNPNKGVEMSQNRKPVPRMCALMPNQPIKNGLNVVLVSTSGVNNNRINIRVFVKDGTDVGNDDKAKEPTSATAQPKQEAKPAAPPSAPATQLTALPQTPAPAGFKACPGYVMLNWDGATVSLVPSWVFNPSPGSSALPVTRQPVEPATKGEVFNFGSRSPRSNRLASNQFSNYDQYSSIISTNGNDDRAYFLSRPCPPPGTKQIDMGIVNSFGTEFGSVVPLPKPYSPGKSGDAAAAGTTFLPQTPLVNYGLYQAIPRDCSQIQPSCIIKFEQYDKYWLYNRNGTERLREHYEEDGWHYGDESDIFFEKDWQNQVETEYYFDTSTQLPRAVMYRRTPNNRYRIENPWILFQTSARPIDKSTVPAVVSVPPLIRDPPPVNTTNTLPEEPKQRDRAKVGWSNFIDCEVWDEHASNPYFHQIGWRMCKVKSAINATDMYGIMNIFSFHGVLGARIWAPREPGEYDRWISRGMQPYMGQSSLGTGYNSTGQWNDNASFLSWGPTEDFPDINLWNEKARSWSETPTMKDCAYARGFEVKDPRDLKSIYWNPLQL